MKISLSEKLLCDIFDLCVDIDETFGDILFGVPRSMKEGLWPEMIQIRRRFEKERLKRNLSKLIYRLKRAGFVAVKEIEGKRGVLITPRGAERILRIKMESEEKRKRTDGKWVMVVFDIPEKRRKIRDRLRSFLRSLGFRMFQKSIWISPYDVLEKVHKLAQGFSLEKSVKVFLIEEVEVV